MSELKRLHSLDAARGLAALAVVIWHWQHMYLIDGGVLDDRSIQPFYGVLFPFYHYGWLAVEFFFTLSGFVFFWLYGQSIADRTLGLGRFWLARFSRLYPLHLLTLLVVAALQITLMANGHQSFVYGGTTWPNFALNLLFLQYFVPGWTFNGPEWSVGVEIILYVLFFFYCRLVRPNWIVPLVLCVVIGLWVMNTQWALGRGIIGFFAGGLVYEAWQRLHHHAGFKQFILPFCAVVAALWVYAILEAGLHPLSTWLDGFGVKGWWWVEMGFRLGLVPLSVLALALHESTGARFWRRLSPLGDLTYALYLWHFPLQLAIALAVILGGLPLAPIQGPVGFVGFMAVLIALSAASYRWIERPAQSWLRERFAPSRVVEKSA
ncbi:acyltransferase family protein [uncultured Devosia sp.]|uniref:acyltransferase family protein n=1 Tax=uncultured Devosia sp. TaxID=211434 RepID=UPI0035CCA56B